MTNLNFQHVAAATGSLNKEEVTPVALAFISEIINFGSRLPFVAIMRRASEAHSSNRVISANRFLP